MLLSMVFFVRMISFISWHVCTAFEWDDVARVVIELG